MSLPLALAIVLAVVIPVQLFRAYRSDESLVERWADEHGLALTPENRPLVARYLRRSRVLRTWGGVAGALLPSLIEFAWSGRVQVLGFGTDGESAPLGFGTIFVGYLVGALCAEISLARPAAGARRSASLVRRELEHYLPRRVILAQRAAAVAGATRCARHRPRAVPRVSPRTPGLASLAIGAVVVLACGAGLEAIERWLVRRPQPFTSPPLVAADDAIRAQSIHALAGAGLALQLLFCCGVALGLQASEVPALQVTMVIPAAVCLVLSIYACRERRRAPLARAPAGRRQGRRPDVILEVDSRSPVPPYEQLRQHVTALVLGGGLAPGDRLPSIRQLANDLGLAGGTVARAYRELESDGVVTTHGRHGTVVEGPPRRPAPPPELIEAAHSYADRAARTGAGLEDALIAVRVAFASER